MNAQAMDRLALESGLRRALERREFRLHYQPKAALADGRITGFEALLRWQRDGRLVPPGEFIPLLEETGMIVQVGEWAIREACAQLAAWRDAGRAAAGIAVNVSARQFTAELVAVVDAALREHRIDEGLLEVEITESDAMRDPARVIEVLQRLVALGVRVAIDDFGTGYSSLGYLKRFPVHTLKLDRSFVTGLPNNPDDVSIARAVIGMAHSLGLKVVAEGVETEGQRSFLAHDGCDEMQGYLLSKPLPAEACTALLACAAAEPAQAAA
jgi:EAL domain-containing protein (putative c-di-GMP-specific phosphodiesterase class I)